MKRFLSIALCLCLGLTISLDASARRIVDSLPEAASLDEAQIRGRVANARGVPLYLVAPSRHQITPLVRALRDFMAERLQALMEQAPHLSGFGQGAAGP